MEYVKIIDEAKRAASGLFGDPDAWRASVQAHGIDGSVDELIRYARAEAAKIGEAFDL